MFASFRKEIVSIFPKFQIHPESGSGLYNFWILNLFESLQYFLLSMRSQSFGFIKSLIFPFYGKMSLLSPQQFFFRRLTFSHKNGDIEDLSLKLHCVSIIRPFHRPVCSSRKQCMTQTILHSYILYTALTHCANKVLMHFLTALS